ncbi:MAG: hypothetical protein QM680_12525 [Luteolibacter sp.]
MNLSRNSILAFGLALSLPSMADDETPKAIHEIPLDEHRVVSVPVSIGRVTTVSFPGPIAAIDAALVSTDDKTRGLFQLAHQPGTSFFSVRSLDKDVTSNVNVRFNNRTYVLELKDSAAPILSLILQQPPDPRLASMKRQATVTPTALLSALDLAKAYPALKESNAALVREVSYKDFRPEPPVMDQGGFEIRLEEVFRFDVQDTLVFRVILHNRTERELKYDPGGFVLKVGDNRFPSAISDASGVIPPKADAAVYFAITGTPTGGRNDLSVENEFVIFLDSENGVLPPRESSNKGGSK